MKVRGDVGGVTTLHDYLLYLPLLAEFLLLFLFGFVLLLLLLHCLTVLQGGRKQ